MAGGVCYGVLASPPNEFAKKCLKDFDTAASFIVYSPGNRNICINRCIPYLIIRVVQKVWHRFWITLPLNSRIEDGRGRMRSFSQSVVIGKEGSGV